MKRIFAYLLLLSLAICLFGCGNGTINLDSFEQLLGQQGTGEENNKPFADKVYIIISEDASSALSAKAQELADNIKTKTGVECFVKYDNEVTVTADDDMELLLGYTNRLASEENLKKLKLGDYICKWDKNKLILGGRYEDATLCAADYFLETVLHGASNTCLMNENACFENIEKYDVALVTLGGYDLYDYTVVYNEENKCCEREISEILRDYIAQKSGYWLKIISSADVNEHTGKQIMLDGGGCSDEAYIATVGSRDRGIFVAGEGSYGLSLAASAFAESLLGVETVNADFAIPIKISRSITNVKIGAMTLIGDDNGSEEYLTEVFATLNQNLALADIMILQGLSQRHLEDVENSLPLEYEMKVLDNIEMAKTVAVYNKSKLGNIICTQRQDVIEINLTLNGADYNIAHTLNGKETNTDIKSLAYQIGSNVIITDEKEENGSLDGSGFAYIGGGECRLGQNKYSRSFYISNETKLTEELYKVEYSGISCAALVCIVNIAQRYAPEFSELAKTLK